MTVKMLLTNSTRVLFLIGFHSAFFLWSWAATSMQGRTVSKK